MIGHEEVRPLTDPDPVLHVDAPLHQGVVLLEELEQVQHHAVAEQAALFRVKNPRGNLVQDELPLAHVDSVAGVGPALVACDDVGVLGQDVHDLPFPLVTPLAPDDDAAAPRCRV